MVINQKGAVQLLLPAVILTIIAFGVLGKVSSSITTTTKFTAPEVLGENKASKKANEQKKESAKINIQSEGKKSEVEIETSAGQKIKTKVEDNGTTKVEIEQEGENEESSGSAGEDEDLDELRSISKFPLRIDTATNQLIMTKNGVERVLTVLPTKAVQNMLRAHLKKGLGPKFFGDATSSATPSASPIEEPVSTESAEITILESQISLEEEDGQSVYKIPAIKKLKIFGIIPVNTNFTSFVSAETGALIKEQESLLSKILNFLSP